MQHDWCITHKKGEKEVNEKAGKLRTRAAYCAIGEEGEVDA